MAQVPYNGGVPEVRPDVAQPDASIRVQSSPTAFGGGVAQGLGELGQGAIKASEFYGTAAADDATNQFQANASKIIRGDPNHMVPGPNGQLQPDTGYLGLRGQAAMNARQGVEKQMDDLLAQLRGNLSTPAQQLRFDEMSKQIRFRYSDQVSSHADAQSQVWYSSVNDSTALLKHNEIAANADNPMAVQNSISGLIDARVKNAQLTRGAQVGDPVYNEAVAAAKQEGLKTWVESIAVQDPIKAVRILDKNKDVAGALYEPLRKQFETRRLQAVGAQEYQAAKTGVAQAPEDLPDIPSLHAPGPTGPGTIDRSKISPELQDPAVRSQLYAVTEAEVGSQGPAAQQAFMESVLNRAQARGMTVAQVLSDRSYFPATTMARAARVASDPQLATKYSALTDNVLQGSNVSNFATGNASGTVGFAGGPKTFEAQGEHFGVEAPDAAWARAQLAAAKAKAPTQTGPEGAATGPLAGFTPTPPPQDAVVNRVAQQKVSAFERIDARTDLSPEEKVTAKAEAARLSAQDQFLETTDAKAKKAASDKAADGYFKRVVDGDFKTFNQDLVNDPTLEPSEKIRLFEFAKQQAAKDPDMNFGKGYLDVLNRIILPAGDPNRITDPLDLLKLESTGALTAAGVQKLSGDMQKAVKSVDGYGIQTTKAGLITYAKSKLSFEQDLGPLKLRDPEGEQAFNAKFLPAFESAYDKWTQAGKDPHEFLTQENVDAIMKPFMRSQKQVATAKMLATGEALPVPPGVEDKSPLPPAPKDIDAGNWASVVRAPPQMDKGQLTHSSWGAIVQKLAESPDENTIKWFDYHFGPAGYKAEDIVRKLKAPPTGPFSPSMNYFEAPGVGG